MKDRELHVAILTENGFEQIELTSPKEALEKEGVKVEILSPQREKVKAWNRGNWGAELQVDKEVAQANAADYDALVVPGGVMNPDKLRMSNDAVEFVKSFLESGKPVAAICHGPQVLIETGLLKGKKMTSYPSLQTDLRNAGADWVDKEVVHDGNLITSRRPADLEAFNREILDAIYEQPSSISSD